MDRILNQLNDWIEKSELSGGSLIIRVSEKEICHLNVGYSDLERKIPITDKSIYRMASMSKLITSVGVLSLIEKGKLGLDDNISRFIPSFANPRVVCDERYVMKPHMNKLNVLLKLMTFRAGSVKTKPAQREITVRDLLSHSSGLEQGVVGLILSIKDKQPNESLEQEMEKYASYPLDFEPGTATGYSPIAGFDVLLRICEIVSGQKAEAYLKKTIFDPLGMSDTGFFLSEEQRSRLVKIYKRKGKRLIDVTGTKYDLKGKIHAGASMTSGAGGLYSSVIDYERFMHMLLNEGSLDGVQILKPETVRLMRSEAAFRHLEGKPGLVWGLGVCIRQDPKKAGVNDTPGTFGWSGAFGTHCFISPVDKLEVVWCTNRADAGGAGSPISLELEHLIFDV